MNSIAMQFLSGLTSAMFLFLLAAGLSLIFGVSRVINVSHGAFYMLGAYLVVTANRFMSMDTIRDIRRYTPIMTTMHSKTRPV